METHGMGMASDRPSCTWIRLGFSVLLVVLLPFDLGMERLGR